MAITPKLVFTTALGGYKVKGATHNAGKIETEIRNYMERNNCTIVLSKGELVFKNKPGKQPKDTR